MLLLLPLLAVLVTAAGTPATHATARPANPLAVYGPAPAALTAHPNIVFVLSDDQPPKGFSATTMPWLFSTSAQWTKFTHAYLNVALCCPSRATILTGEYSQDSGVEYNVYPNDPFLLYKENHEVARWLKRAPEPYRTALIGKYLNSYPGTRTNVVPAGWDVWHAFADEPAYYCYDLYNNSTRVHYGAAGANDASDVTASKCDYNSKNYSTNVLTTMATSFIHDSVVNHRTSPFFLYFAPKSVHLPWTHPFPSDAAACASEPTPHDPNYNEPDVSDKPAWVRAINGGNPLSATQLATVDWAMRQQECMALVLDRGMHAIYNELQADGVLNNTVFIYLTDNGYAHGEHRFNHKRCEYEDCIKTALWVRYPFAPPVTVDKLVSNVDFGATFAALAGVTPGLAQDGYSLVPLLRNPAASWSRDATGVLIHWAGGWETGDGDGDRNPGSGCVDRFWGIRTKDYKYVELPVTHEKELYDLRPGHDPYERWNVAGQPAYAAVQADLAAKLAKIAKNRDDTTGTFYACAGRTAPAGAS